MGQDYATLGRDMVLRALLLVIASAVSLNASVTKDVVYAMRGGLAMLMDVYAPERPNGHGIVFIAGSGWHAPLA